MDWDKLKTLLATPASATNPERDHELAAMVPELLDMITLKSFGFNDPQAENAKRIVSEREKPPTQLSEAAAKMLERLRQRGTWCIYVDEIRAANELVKAGLAMFPATEARYGDHVKYMNVAVVADRTGWADEGTLPPLTDRELQSIEVVSSEGAYAGVIDDAVNRLIDIGIFSRNILRWSMCLIEFSDAVKQHHIRSKPEAQPTPPPSPKRYHLMVVDAGERCHFRDVGIDTYFLDGTTLLEKTGANEGKEFGSNSKGYFDLKTIVQPVTISWEPA